MDGFTVSFSTPLRFQGFGLLPEKNDVMIKSTVFGVRQTQVHMFVPYR